MKDNTWELTTLRSKICEKFAGQFPEALNKCVMFPCDISVRELYDHINLRIGRTNTDCITSLMGDLPGFYELLESLTPEKQNDLFQALRERINAFILDLSELKKLLFFSSKNTIMAIVHTMEVHICTLITNREQLGDFYCLLTPNWEANEHIMRLVYSRLVSNKEDHDYLIACLQADPKISVMPEKLTRKLTLLNELWASLSLDEAPSLSNAPKLSMGS
jgi:hypothetical protein